MKVCDVYDCFFLDSLLKHLSFYCNFLENPDMEISPDSTPTSEPSYSSPTANQHTNNTNVNSNSLNHDDAMMTSPNGHLTKHSLNTINSNNQFHHQLSNASSSALNSNSKTNSNSNKNSTITSSTSPSTHNYQSHHRRSMSPPNDSERTSAAAANLHNNVGGHDRDTNILHHNSNSLRSSPSYSGNNTNAALATGINNSSVSRLELNNSNNTNHLDGPPTPEQDLNSGEHRRRELNLSLLAFPNL
jgi:hypothetical protein